MSVENVKAFIEKVRADDNLASKIVNLSRKIDDSFQKDTLVEDFVRIASEAGYSFTAEEFIAFDTNENVDDKDEIDNESIVELQNKLKKVTEFLKEWKKRDEVESNLRPKYINPLDLKN